MHLHYINDLVDVFRAIVAAVLFFSLYILLVRFKRNGKDWNTKTRDLWYSLFMWTIAGITLMFQGILLDRPLTPATMAVFAASFVTGKGVFKKGDWGGSDT